MANGFAIEAEEAYEEGRWKLAADRFEEAAEAYVQATLLTSDTTALQALRQLALSHSQRAHELKCLFKLHSLHAGGSPEAATRSGGSAAEPLPAGPSAAVPSVGTSATKGAHTSTTPQEAADVSRGGGEPARLSRSDVTPTVGSRDETSAALLRLGSTLLGTLETIRFGAEELVGCELVLPPTLGGGSGGAASVMNDSYCMVTPNAAASVASVSSFGPSSPLTTGLEGQWDGPAFLAAAGDDEMHAALASSRQKASQLASENERLRREVASLRLRTTEFSTTLVRAERRAHDQLRLVRRAIASLREINQTPRLDVPEDAAAEIRELRSQLEDSHKARRQQADHLRKYEQRWKQLKASARQKQAQQQLAAAAGGGGTTTATPSGKIPNARGAGASPLASPQGPVSATPHRPSTSIGAGR